MFKKVISAFLVICVLFSLIGCKGNGGTQSGTEYNSPSKIITLEEYHSRIKGLLEYENFSTADDKYFKTLEELGTDLENMIMYSTNDVTECEGTKYYVSNNGDDNADGKTPETAWATLDKVNSINFKEGDLVVFERGGLWRGHIAAKSGVTYSAYGEGLKPKIYSSLDGIAYADWVETDTPNVWKLDKKIFNSDIGVLVFDGVDKDALYAEKKSSLKAVKKDLDFAFCGSYIHEGKTDNYLYLYSEEGNPAKRFSSIEVSLKEVNVTTVSGTHDVLVNNLDLKFGYKPFDLSYCNNITFTYCINGWQGGHFQNKGDVRAGGGGYAMPDSDNTTIDSCVIYQQFDSGVTPQVAWETKGKVAEIENFVVKNCLFDGCEYTLEYFNTQPDNTENCFKGLYFGYNFCRTGGYGFGTKPGKSAYIKSWGHENTCYDSVFEYNIFDRALSNTLEVISYKQLENGKREISYELMPTLRNNVYIQEENKRFGDIADKTYRYKKSDLEKYLATGIDKGSVFMFAPKTED